MPGGLEELEQKLQNQGPDENVTETAGRGRGQGSTENTAYSQGQPTNKACLQSSVWSKIRAFFNSPAQPEIQTDLELQDQRTLEDLRLLLCVPYRATGTRLEEQNISKVARDRRVFCNLRKAYTENRAKFISALSLRRLKSIYFVNFSAHAGPKRLVDVSKKDTVLSAEEKDRYGYDFERVGHCPPIGANLLMHLY